MFYVSLLVEIMRLRPRLIFWFAILTQAAIWAIVPSLFYSAPPGNVATVLAIGHAHIFAPEAGPPLAYWLADLAFRAAGNNAAGVYVLAQLCVIATYWAVFSLGSRTLGERHAVLAVMLMIGVSALSIPTPEFGPAILAMPLWALAMLHLWRAVGEDNSIYWFALTLDLGLLLLTSHLAFPFIALVVLFVAISPRARAHFRAIEPNAAALILLFMTLPSAALLMQTDEVLVPNLMRLRSVAAAGQNFLSWIELCGIIALSHAGVLIFVVLANNFTWARPEPAPVIDRAPASEFARHFIYYFAILPALVVTLGAAIAGYAHDVHPAPLVVLSALAIVAAAGDRIPLHHQRLLGFTWFGLLLIPPVLAAVAVVATPWILGSDLKVAQPAKELGQFFAENFERRSGKPLTIVGGEQQLALLIALGAPSRPSPVIEQPGFPRLVSEKDIAEKGAIIVWPATDVAGTPPAAIKTRFPALVPEVARVFDRPIEGRLPLLRIGWGMIRPQGAAPQ